MKRRRLRHFVMATLVLLVASAPARASHDPNRTATILVGGFDPNGASQTGLFGADVAVPLVDDIAGLVGLPTLTTPGGFLLPNLVTSTEYYGDTPPAYYDASDLADLLEVTALWGGGVPRYALIVAKYARFVLERSGAAQVNFVGASFGALIVRWLIEKDVEGLASEGRIARWLAAEGVVSGSWPASQGQLLGLWEAFEIPPIDVTHMQYGWIETNLHAPRTDASSPQYANILIGQVGATEDHLNGRALTTAMLLDGAFQPNDGVQALGDTYFHSVAPQARFAGIGPTRTVFHNDHYGLETDRGAWAQAIAFLTQKRRITVTMTRAQVHNLHEPNIPFLNLRPAEIVFQSSVYSLEAARRWGITEPVAELVLEGIATPIRNYAQSSETQVLEQVIFDDLVLDGETQLRVDLRANEIDLELRYGVSETLVQPFIEDLGGGSIVLAVEQAGTFAFSAPEWNCDLHVEVHDYPFALPTDVHEAPTLAGQLRVFPNPFRGQLVIAPQAVPVQTTGVLREQARLVTCDVRGRLVRELAAAPGASFRWDGRDSNGNPVPPGVYFHYLHSSAGTLFAKSIHVDRLPD